MRVKNIKLVLNVVLAVAVGAFGRPVFQQASIFPLQDKHVHSSSIVQAPNGDLLACWFHGSGERTADDVLIRGARLQKGAEAWSPVFSMADTPGFPDCNPVLFVDAQERLHLFWIAVLAHRWEMSLLKHRTAEDWLGDGPPRWNRQEVITLKPGDAFAEAVKQGFAENASQALWAEYAPSYEEQIIRAAQDPAKRQMGWMTRTHLLILPGGRILLPLYSDGFCLGLAAISDDGGETWRAAQPMVGPGLNQPSIVRKKDGTLVAYMRDEGPIPSRVFKSISKDDGETWSYAVKTAIPNPSSSLEVVALANGHWVMIFNDVEDGRYSFAAALSDDEGETWKWKRHIALAEKGQKSFSYPSLIQADDGLLHLTYSYGDGHGQTIKYAVFNEEWIKE